VLGTDLIASAVLQSEHKIQSGKGSLQLEMDQVPKILKPLVDEWSSGGYIVSFKVRYALLSTLCSSLSYISVL
jgi:phosphopantothenate-cysteine ligase